MNGSLKNQYQLPAQSMIEGSVESCPELVMMKAKVPTIKKRSIHHFPYSYHLAPLNIEKLNSRTQTFMQLLKTKPEPSQLTSFLDVILSKVQGMSGTLNPSEQLVKLFQYESKDFWKELVGDKITLKHYGIGKKKQNGIWESKDLDILKELFDVETHKKYRKVAKQFSTVSKAVGKFLQKIQKIDEKNQNAIKELYEEYKKMETEDNKYIKLLQQNNLEKSQKQIENVNVGMQEVKIIDETEKNISLQKLEQKEQEERQPLSKIISEKSQNKKQQIKKSVKGNKKSQAKNEAKQYPTLDFFLKKKKQEQAPSSEKKQEDQKKNVEKDNLLYEYLKGNKVEDTEFLREKFKGEKLSFSSGLPYYSNIILPRSRIEYLNFHISESKIPFIEPTIQTQNNPVYEDSSEQFSELIAQSINNDQMVDEEVEEAEEESNSAIVPDSFCEFASGAEESSLGESEEDEKNVIIGGSLNIGKWSYPSENSMPIEKYFMIPIGDQKQVVPFPLKEFAEETSQINPQIKIDIYKEIHGSYISRDQLVKKISSLIENKMSQNKIHSMLKDVTEKNSGQRVLKSDVLKEFSLQYQEIAENLEQEFEKIRKEREDQKNFETLTRREQRQNQKDQKLQKLLREYSGEFTMTSILEYLKSKELKLIKSDLSSFLRSKEGQFWENLREQIKKNRIRKKYTKKIKEQNGNIKVVKPINEMMEQMKKTNGKKREESERDMVEEAMQIQIDLDDESYQVKQKKPVKWRKTRGSRKKAIQSIIKPLAPQRRSSRRQAKIRAQVEQQMEEEEQEKQAQKQDVQEQNIEIEEKSMNEQQAEEEENGKMKAQE